MLHTYRHTPLETTQVIAVNRSWIPQVELLQELFKPVLVHVRLPNGVHVVAPLQKKLNSNLYELLFPSQLLVWKDNKKATSND
ncbi:hypothetical protein [Cognaticolwellia mytili]|uniref:hypothetical protein n=1 Tax=Cognaticolwellia mytili TaxID=1888913 RepID=UPI000A16E99A|nr:hypothetical protein [Cognaticolwellia mytili]